MNSYSASFNFQSGFLWGIVPDKSFLSNRDNVSSFIFMMKEKGISAIRLEIFWSDCEPLKGNYDESYIESVRSVISRIRSQNIQSVIVLNTSETPKWQNLDHPQKPEKQYEDRLLFSRHMIDALIPYTNFLCLTDEYFTDRTLTAGNHAESYYRETAQYLHELTDTVQIGLILSDKTLNLAQSSVYQLIHRSKINLLKSIPMDFLGSYADQSSMSSVQSLYGNNRLPVFFVSDGLRSAASGTQTESLADKLYDTWMMYQKGWRILGYCSDINITENNPTLQLYENSTKHNAFEISTETGYLPEKWQTFLRS